MKIQSLIIAIFTLFLLTACSDEKEETGHETSHISITPFRWLDGMDPAKDWNGFNATRFMICETLITLNENFELEPLLAKSWEQVDEITYIFILRDNVTFSNGTILTADAVKKSLERVLEMNIRGKDAKIDTILAEGSKLTITTTEAFPTFLYNLTDPMYTIVDVTALEEVDTKPIGTGAYLVESHISQEKVELIANENYWQDVPSIKNITLRNIAHDMKADALLAGDIDVAQGPSATSLAKLENNPKAQILTRMGVREYDIILNCRKGHPLSDLALRQAISYAINRDIVAKIIGAGYAQAINTPFPQSVGYGFEKLKGQEYNVEKARQILLENTYIDIDKDGYIEDKEGKNLEFSLHFQPNIFGTALAEAIQDMLKQVGIKINLNVIESISYTQEAHANVDLFLDGILSIGIGDGERFLKASFTTNGSDNYGAYSNPQYDEIIAKLEKTFDTQERMALFIEAQQFLIDEAVNIWLYSPDDVVIASSKISGISLHPLNSFFVSTDWKIEN